MEEISPTSETLSAIPKDKNDLCMLYYSQLESILILETSTLSFWLFKHTTTRHCHR